MATADGENVQRAEKATLKRKLTGPPRLLLLGKTRSRSVEEDRCEERTENETTTTSSAAAERDTTANMDEEVSSEVNVESCRGRCGAAGEDDGVRKRKVNRRRWWRRFLPASVCNRKQRRDVEESLEKQEYGSCVPPEGALQETDAAALSNTEETTTGVKERKRFNMRMWPMLRRLQTSSDVPQTQEQKRDFGIKDGDEPSTSFREKMRKFFSIRGKRRASGIPLENTEDMTMGVEALGSPGDQVDEPAGLHSNETVQSLEVVTVVAEIREETSTKEQLVCDIGIAEEDLTDAVDGPDTIQSDCDVVEDSTDTNNAPDLTEVASPEEDEVFCESSEVVLDTNNQLSVSTAASPRGTTSQSLQPSMNGPSIRIELVPPDDVAQDDEEEECWEDNQNHLLLLLSFEHSERQLLQTARSLVRAAMNAAVDQLTREQQSDSGCVHREPPGCRDHA